MTLRHLQIFKTVCEKMSITAAAEELNMTQPAVSIAVKELESFYDTVLFDRLGRKIYLTETGEKLRSYAEAITSRFTESVFDIRGKQNFVSCKMGVNITVGESCLADILAFLKKAAPDTQIYVTVDNNKTVERKLMQNEIDFAVTDAPSDSQNLIIEKLYNEKSEAVCAPEFTEKTEISAEELASFPLLFREKGSGCRECADRIFENKNRFPVPKAESVSTLSLINLAKKGLGAAILPSSVVLPEIKKGKLKVLNVTDSDLTRSYFLICRSGKFLSPAAEKCIENIKGFFKDRNFQPQF